MIWKVLELMAGAAATGAALLDVFRTVVVPRPLSAGLHAPDLIRRIFLPLWVEAAKRKPSRPAETLLSVFAGFLLLATFAAWVLLLMLGLSLMALGLGHDFSPPLGGFGEALFASGSAMMTLGLSGHTASGWARAVTVFAGVAGLAVVTLTLTYILQIQQGLHDRDTQVMTLRARAGAPPSAVALLETMGELDLRPKLGGFFAEWEEWSALLLQLQGGHAVLGYFRSPDPDNDWLLSLGAVLDAAALVLSAVVDEARGEATLMLRSGAHTAKSLCQLYKVTAPEPKPVDPAELARAIEPLRAAGYALRPIGACAAEFDRRRRAYAGHVQGLCDHFAVIQPAWTTPMKRA